MIELSIALVNWNTKDLLDQCLAAIYSCADGVRYEIIVVDNASRDGSADMVAEKYADVRLICNTINRGFAAGCNVAFKNSTGRYSLLLNTDTVVLDGALQAMVAFMDDRSDAGAVGCKLLNPDGSLQRSCSRFPNLATELFDALYLSKLFPGSKLFGCYSMSYWDFDATREVDFAGGSCLMVRREAVEKVGLFDEGYFMYTEEADWCYRLRQRGWRVYYFPEAQVVHFGGQSARRFGSNILLHLYVGRHRFVKKHQGAAAAAAVRVIIAFGALCRLAAYSLRRLKCSSDPCLGEQIGFQRKLLTWTACGRLNCEPERQVGIR